MRQDTDIARTAEDIAAAATDHLRDRIVAAAHEPGWRNPDVREAFVRVLRRIEITADPAGTVRATAPKIPNGDLWAYAGHDAVAAALRSLPTATTAVLSRLDRYTFELTVTP